ncbi:MULTISPECIES: ABC transporter permease [unclassified Inquilinus]|jgi:ribose transport system permease protein|uniref:ABC transporter permease n=1 Tax=unclassified Inquilinus TaxID=2645927 RepID=UPI003F93BD1D
MTAFLRSVDRPILVACGFVILILMAGTAYTMITQGTATFLSPTYLLQQLKVASFMGVIAAGMMLVILMGHIDLSVPWTITASAMLATAVGGPEAIPVGLGVGMLVGLFNGLGVAFLRVPSMIFTLGVNTVLRGLMVMLTGGFSPTSMATPPMEFLAKTELLGIPMAVFVWILLSLALVFLLTRMPMGRYIYAIGNREAAAYLSGVNTRLVIVGGFVLCGFCAALAGILLAGYSSKAYQAMGDTYLLPSIAAVVIGGTNILGGQGRYAGTVVGTILIVLLQSVLSVMQMPEAGRQIIYGLVIILMLVLYGRGGRAAA